MTVEEVREMVWRFVDEPWNKGNIAVIDELCAPDYTVREETSTEISDREGLKKAVLDARAKAPDYRATVEETVVEGDKVIYEWTMSWTEEGKPKKGYGFTLLTLRDGKIWKDRFVWSFVEDEQAAA